MTPAQRPRAGDRPSYFWRTVAGAVIAICILLVGGAGGSWVSDSKNAKMFEAFRVSQVTQDAAAHVHEMKPGHAQQVAKNKEVDEDIGELKETVKGHAVELSTILRGQDKLGVKFDQLRDEIRRRVP